MRLWTDQLLPRLTDVALDQESVSELRRRVFAGLSGRVLEIGAGGASGLAHLPGEVEELLAVEPSAVARRRFERAARERLPGVRCAWIGPDARELPLEDGAVDAALSCFTLCTVPEPERVLAEIVRVLRPGGGLHFLEHGLAQDARTARLQARWNGVQQRLCGGCCLDRPIDRWIQGSGLRLEWLERELLPGARKLGELYLGRAVRRSAG